MKKIEKEKDMAAKEKDFTAQKQKLVIDRKKERF